MKSGEENKPSRREFLAAVSTAPALMGGAAGGVAGSLALLPAAVLANPSPDGPDDAAAMAYAEHRPPYLALEQFITEGHDEFPGEKAAIEIEDKLQLALGSGELPIGQSVRGLSPWPKTYRKLARDLEEAVYDPSDLAIAAGWQRWRGSLGTIRRSRFYVLPDDRVRFEVASEARGGLTYRVGHWKQVWSDGKIVEWSPEWEHVALAREPYFHDVTASVFAKTPSFLAQMARGIPYWRSTLDLATGIDIFGSNGIAAGDVDGDGVDEIYVSQPGGLPNRLYKPAPDGTFHDITDEWGAGILDDTSCALFLDLRNTGRQDLVVLRSSGPVLLINDGSRFLIRDDAFRFAKAPPGGFTGMAAADYDRDGKLDLYLCTYVYFQSEAQYTYPAPYHDAQNGPPNFLFRNALNSDGSGFLDDVTAETGMNQNNNRFSFAPAWCDYNGDGWPDLYVANDFGRKNLYHNKDGHFEDVAAAAGVEDLGPGMSTSWFDYDGDGKPDLYVANMWTEIGQRLVRDPAFVPSRGEFRDAYLRHAKGNSLYRNRGDGTFEDTGESQHLQFGRWSWGSGGHDLDNDGHPEILVTCGMLSAGSPQTTRRKDLMGFFWRQVVARAPVKAMPSATYENGWNAINQFVREEYGWSANQPNVVHVRRGDRYYDFSGVTGLDWADDSRSFVVTDFDGDGRPDVILKSRLGPQVRVLQNNCATANRSIALRLEGTKSNRDAIGTRVDADGQVKWLEAGSGFLAQHSKRMIFGLGTAESVKLLRITWPSGHVQDLENLRAGFTYRIVEGGKGADAQPFRPPIPLESKPVEVRNDLAVRDTWLLEPVPLPEPQTGPCLLVIRRGDERRLLISEEMRVIDLDAATPERRQYYEIFRRYLFDWRTELHTPLFLLLNEHGQVVKVYAERPTNVLADLASLEAGGTSALPFHGIAIREMHRDYYKLGAAFLWYGYPEQALPYLEQALVRTPDNPRVLLLVGQIHLRAGRLDQAEQALDKALQANGGFAEAQAELGGVSEARGDWPRALAQYKEALALKPDLLDTLLNAAEAANHLGDTRQSEEFLRRALKVNPDSADAANRLGLLCAKQDRTDEARTYFEQAIAKKRDFAGAINNLGVLYLKTGKVSDAIAAFQYGIQVTPDEEILYLNLGRIYAQRGALNKARELMQSLLDRKPDSELAKKALRELQGR
jgi:tetratricopeptide (TPR) repeat protein